MKKIYLLLLITIFLAACSNAQEKNQTPDNTTLSQEAQNAESAPSDNSGVENTKEKNEQDSGEAVYQKISAEEAKKMMDNQEVIVVDVRTIEEYQQGHVPNALSLPLDSIQDKAETTLANKETTLLLYCRSGRRSEAASQILLSLGYKNIYDFGGINDWPYDIEK